MLRAFCRAQASLCMNSAYGRQLQRQPFSRFIATESKPQEQQPDNSNASSETDAEPLPEQPSLEGLAKEIEEKDACIAELNEKTLRILAEIENVRMIARRDVEIAKKYSITPFARALLSVADNLHLALKSIPESAISGDDENPQLKGLYFGVSATQTELLKVFSQHGITRFGEVGDAFDPNKYQAMFEAPSAEHQPGVVVDVTKLGYTLGDRILRPAEVGVSKSS